MEEGSRPNRSPLLTILTVMLSGVLPIAVGLLAAPSVVPQPKVGVARLSFDIISESAFEITEQLAFARDDPAIRAVVLIINSPGGSAAYSEELYLDVLNTRRKMPVVASVDLLAASGAYYMAAAADEIIAKPTSVVGSIGVITSLPGDIFLDEELLTTGPYKSFGGTRDSFTRGAERAKFAFLAAVLSARQGRLSEEASAEFLSRAEVYSGVRAFELGLIDALGANDEAVQRAAALAGIRNYEVVELYPLAFEAPTGEVFGRYEPLAIDAQALWALPTNLPPGLYFRYFEAANQ